MSTTPPDITEFPTIKDAVKKPNYTHRNRFQVLTEADQDIDTTETNMKNTRKNGRKKDTWISLDTFLQNENETKKANLAETEMITITEDFTKVNIKDKPKPNNMNQEPEHRAAKEK